MFAKRYKTRIVNSHLKDDARKNVKFKNFFFNFYNNIKIQKTFFFSFKRSAILSKAFFLHVFSLHFKKLTIFFEKQEMFNLPTCQKNSLISPQPNTLIDVVTLLLSPNFLLELICEPAKFLVVTF